MRPLFLPAGVVLALALLGGTACNRARAEADTGLPSPQQLLASDSAAVCLSDPGAAGPLDEALRDQQARARKLTLSPDRWIQVARGWVKKARNASDPSLYVQVDRCVDVVLWLDPASLPALDLRALVLRNEHRFEEARKVAAEVLARDPRDFAARGLLSDTLLELGRFDEAERTAQALMDERPDAAAHARGAYLRWLAGDVAGAKALWKQALATGRDARDPGATAWLFTQAAMVFLHEADLEGADAVFTQAERWVPDYPAALVGRGRVALAQGKTAAAIGHLERAWKGDPLPETAWLLGDARQLAGDEPGAKAAYDDAVKLGRRIDKLTLAYFLSTKGWGLDEALAAIDEERKTRGGVYLDDVHAWVLYRLGRTAEARQAIRRATKHGTRDARLLYHLGAIELAAGDPAGKEHLREALRLHPAFDVTGAADARRLLGLR